MASPYGISRPQTPRLSTPIRQLHPEPSSAFPSASGRSLRSRAI